MAVPLKGLGCVCREKGQVAVEELTFMPPGPGEVRLKVHACGLCHSDVSVINRTIAVPLPCVLGHEGAGVVEAVGPSVTKWKVGDRVILSLVMPCNGCPECLAGRPSLCSRRPKIEREFQKGARVRDASMKAVRSFTNLGCMAEYAVVSELALVRTDDDIPLEKGALVSCGVTTGAGAAINCAKMSPGSSCCVFGCGGVGLSAIQGARICGAKKIIAVDMVPSKLAAAKRFGATHCVNASEVKDVNKEIWKLSKGGTDFAFEAIGLTQTASQTVKAVRSGGMAVFVGIVNHTETIPVSPTDIIVGEKIITGSFMGSSVPSTFVPMLCDLYKKGDLLLDEMVSKYYHIEDARAAFDDLAAGSNLRGVFVMHDLKSMATGNNSNL